MAEYPRFIYTAAAVFALGVLSGCKAVAPVTQTVTPAATPAYNFPSRPTATPPAFKIFHQDNDTYTLVTKPDATDDEISAILWQFRDAAHAHGFDALHLSQKFIDTRKPSVWFHVYRGPKCASEKYSKGPLPCDASYHGAGDFTLGAYHNPAWNDAVLRRADGSETHLWDSDAPDAAAKQAK
jgi:hypothetical protein